ncbi:hypothetical protein TgHK011_000204 [Trichoderma gracile]|nr:hypothetical protein TgHK011_000204 [Trichoderma gracile]
MALPSESPPRAQTPLDTFFLSFSHQGFVHNPAKSPVNSWKALCKFQSWSNKPNDHPPKQKAWKRYQAALVKEVELYFGDVDDITAWKTILKTTHVNLVDLITWAKQGGEESGNKVRVFKSVSQLRDYTRKTGKIMSRSQTKNAEGRNVVLKFLLRRIFN